jgi:hypothetical protein
MANLKPYKLRPGKTHYEGGKRPIPAGTIVRMTSERFEVLRDRFEPVDDTEATAQERKASPKTTNRSPVGLLETLHWKQAVCRIQQAEDKRTVARLHEEELGARARPAVLQAAEARIQELDGQARLETSPTEDNEEQPKNERKESSE